MVVAVFDDALAAALSRWGLTISPCQAGQFRAHYLAILEANRTMNLTRIVEPDEAAVKHYADSLALCVWAGQRGCSIGTLLDIGTGAGFPAVPMAIARPEWKVTAIDATAKKAAFVERVSASMGLDNVRVEHGHSQYWKPGRTFDVVTLRAVAQVDKALSQAVGHAASGGWVVCYRTASAARAEAGEGRSVALPASLRLDSVFEYDLQVGGETIHRALQIFRT